MDVGSTAVRRQHPLRRSDHAGFAELHWRLRRHVAQCAKTTGAMSFANVTDAAGLASRPNLTAPVGCVVGRSGYPIRLTMNAIGRTPVINFMPYIPEAFWHTRRGALLSSDESLSGERVREVPRLIPSPPGRSHVRVVLCAPNSRVDQRIFCTDRLGPSGRSALVAIVEATQLRARMPNELWSFRS